MSDKNRTAYPVVLTLAKEGGYCVHLPDFDRDTQGEDLADALVMAQDALEMMGALWQDEGTKVPPPSSAGSIEAKEGEIVTLVAVDFDEYRRRTSKKPVKKTLTIPSWLNAKAEEEGINFSETLKSALRERLGV